MKPLLLTLLLASLASAAELLPLTVDSTALGKTVVVKGTLGQPLGRLITIEGAVAGPEHLKTKAQQGRTWFLVRKVKGKDLPAPCLIELPLLPADTPAAGKTTTLRGYEDGGFRGIPAAALKEMTAIPQTTSWAFVTFFHVVKQLRRSDSPVR